MTTAVIQPALADTYLDWQNPNTNYGSTTQLCMGTNGAAIMHAALLKFDLSSIPSRAVLDSATLGLYLFSNTATLPGTFSIYRALRNWADTQATQNYFSTGNAWAYAGCLGSQDYDNTVLATLALAAEEGAGWKEWVFNAAGRTAVLAMVKGTYPNYGFVSHHDAEYTKHSFYSSDYMDDVAKRPILTVEYHLIGGYPRISIL